MASLAIYPDVLLEIPATLPLEFSTARAVLATEFDNGLESRRLLWNSHRRNVNISYNIMEFVHANELRRFYEDRKGSFEAFVFYFPQIEYYVKEFTGIVTSSGHNVFPLPSKQAQSYTLYKNNTALNGTEWTFSPGGGPQEDDMATLNFEPAIGEVYTYTFTGRLKITAKFSDSPLVFSDVKRYWSSTSVDLIGLEPTF